MNRFELARAVGRAKLYDREYRLKEAFGLSDWGMLAILNNYDSYPPPHKGQGVIKKDYTQQERVKAAFHRRNSGTARRLASEYPNTIGTL